MAEATRKETKQTAMPLSTFLFVCAFSALLLGKAHGSGGFNSGSLTALQKHVAFFDTDKDGVVNMHETFQGMRAIGLDVSVAAEAAMFINGDLSTATSPTGIPTPLSPVYVANIKKGLHGSHSGAYDSEGRFVPEKFEEVFTKYGKTKQNALTSKEIDDVIQGLQQHNDPMGHFAGIVEWRLLYTAAKDKDGFLHKNTARGVFDGSLFVQLAQHKSS